MVFIEDIRAATTSVAVTHGRHTFNLECALEKEAEQDPAETTERTTHAMILRDRYELEIKATALRNRAQERIAQIGQLADVDAFAAQLQSERDAKLGAAARKKAGPMTLEEIEAAATEKIKAWEGEIEEIRGEIDQNKTAIRFLRAKEIAFLVAGSDIGNKATGELALCGKVDKTPEELDADAKVFASFSDALLEKCFKAVSSALDGPLGNPT